MDKDELVKSGWPQFMNCELMMPSDATTTLRNTSDRVIDYVLMSRCIVGMLKSIFIDLTIPTTPHFSLAITLYRKPRTFMEPVLSHPRELPIVIFKANWKNLNAFQQKIFFVEALLMAKFRLAAQKSRTGMAILGRPLPELIQDEKVMSRFNDSMQSGELFAEASLASELLVLLVSNISRDDCHQYIGRGQFPKFLNKPVVPKNKKGQYSRGDLNQWANLLPKIRLFLDYS